MLKEKSTRKNSLKRSPFYSPQLVGPPPGSGSPQEGCSSIFNAGRKQNCFWVSVLFFGSILAGESNMFKITGTRMVTNGKVISYKKMPPSLPRVHFSIRLKILQALVIYPNTKHSCSALSNQCRH